MFYARGYRDGRADANKEMERVLAVLREELARKDKELAAANQRVAILTDKMTLVNELGMPRVPGVPMSTGLSPAEQIVAGKIMRDTFEELPAGHPDGTYGSPKEMEL